MKQYSRLILILALILSLAVLMIACGDEVPMTPVGDETSGEATVTSDGEVNAQSTTASGGAVLGGDGAQDTVKFEDLLGSGTGSEAGETTDSGDETTDRSSVTIVDDVVPDSDKQFGPITPGTPVN